MRTILGGVAVAALLAGCGGETGRFYIVHNLVPQAGCVITTDRTLYRGEGLLDVSLVGSGDRPAYELFPLLQNDYPAATGAGNPPQPNRLFVRAFRVWSGPGDGAPQRVFQLYGTLANSEQTRSLIEFQQPWAATIEPGGGLLAAAVDVIPGELARQLRDTGVMDNGAMVPLEVRVRAVGERLDGEVESQEFVYPLKACLGCLVGTVRPCPFMPARRGNACNIAQDATVDCCSAGAELTCPAVPAQ
jgi:hypothetical protein